jgi:hypothetical protein
MPKQVIEAQCPPPPSVALTDENRLRVETLQQHWRESQKNALLNALQGNVYGTLTFWDPETGSLKYNINSFVRGVTLEEVIATVRQHGFTLLGGNGDGNGREHATN